MNGSVRLNDVAGESNKKLILNALRFKGNMSRADLSRLLELSFPAVSSNVRGLLDENCIMEIGVGDNVMGRKSTLLSFNAERGFIIGVDLGRFRVRMMLADLLGNEIVSAEIKNSTTNTKDGMESISRIEDFAMDILNKSGKNKDDILCIVIGMPGIIKDGISPLGPYAQKNLVHDMVGTLQESFEADVILENCVNLGVIGEQWKGAGKDCSNITYIAYGVGLGSAHIIDDKLYIGPNGSAGEIGFMVTDPVYISNKYSKSGSLEQLLSLSKIEHYLKSGDFNEEIIKLIHSYKSGDDIYARLMLDEISLNFCIMLVNIVSILNPEIVIIAGGLGYNLGKLFLDQWVKTLDNQVPFSPKLVLSELNHTETMLGAVARGIEHVHGYRL